MTADTDTVAVDLHDHMIPPGALAALRRAGNPFRARFDGAVVRHEEGVSTPVEPEMHDVEARLATLDACGIATAVISPSPTLIGCNHPAGEARAACELLNDGIVALAAQAPERLLPMAAIPTGDPAAAVAELDRMATAGARAVLIGTHAPAGRLGDPALLELWQRLDELGLPVLLHPFFAEPKPGMEGHYLTNLVGNPVETTVAAADLILSGVLDACPKLEILLAHGGGFLPYQLGRLLHGYQARPEARRDCSHPPDWYLGALYYDTLVYSGAALAYLVRWAGTDHVVVGTDLPFDMADRDPAATLREAGLDEWQRDMVLRGTAGHLLRREGARR